MLFRGDCMNIGCVIMASGLGKRFGGNKLLCDFHGEPMIQRILDATGAVPFAGRVVVTRYPEVAQICQLQRISCVLHDLPLRSDTVRLGVERLSADCPELDGILFAAADQPRLKAERIAALCGQRVQVGGAHGGVSVAAQHIIARGIGHNPNKLLFTH